MAVFTFAIPCKGMSYLFVDNTVALSCLVKGFSRQRDLNAITATLSVVCTQHQCNISPHYVHTKVNLADGLSRGDVKWLLENGAAEIDSVQPAQTADEGSWLSV